eukprot:PhM_4_TR15782/c0_g1_i1/m.100743
MSVSLPTSATVETCVADSHIEWRKCRTTMIGRVIRRIAITCGLYGRAWNDVVRTVARPGRLTLIVGGFALARILQEHQVATVARRGVVERIRVPKLFSFNVIRRRAHDILQGGILIYTIATAVSTYYAAVANIERLISTGRDDVTPLYYATERVVRVVSHPSASPSTALSLRLVNASGEEGHIVVHSLAPVDGMGVQDFVTCAWDHVRPELSWALLLRQKGSRAGASGQHEEPLGFLVEVDATSRPSAADTPFTTTSTLTPPEPLDMTVYDVTRAIRMYRDRVRLCSGNGEDTVVSVVLCDPEARATVSGTGVASTWRSYLLSHRGVDVVVDARRALLRQLLFSVHPAARVFQNDGSGDDAIGRTTPCVEVHIDTDSVEFFETARTWFSSHGVEVKDAAALYASRAAVSSSSSFNCVPTASSPTPGEQKSSQPAFASVGDAATTAPPPRVVVHRSCDVSGHATVEAGLYSRRVLTRGGAAGSPPDITLFFQHAPPTEMSDSACLTAGGGIKYVSAAVAHEAVLRFVRQLLRGGTNVRTVQFRLDEVLGNI